MAFFLSNLHGKKLVLEQKKATRNQENPGALCGNTSIRTLCIDFCMWFSYVFPCDFIIPNFQKPMETMWLLLLWQVYGMDGIQTFPLQQNGTWNHKIPILQRSLHPVRWEATIRLGCSGGIIFVAGLHLSFKRKLGAPGCSKIEEMPRISIWSFLWRKKDCLKDWHSFQVNQLYIEYLSFCFAVKKNEATHRFFGGSKKLPPLRCFPPPNPGCSPPTPRH